MNKILFRVSGIILAAQALYAVFYHLPIAAQTLRYGGTSAVVAGSLIVGVTILLVAGIGLLFVKRWPVALLWLWLIIAICIVNANFYNIVALGGLTALIIDAVIAIALGIEWKRARNRSLGLTP